MHPAEEDSSIERLASVVAEVAHLLPAQGPIRTFIHHNTLHAFEARPFEEAVVNAGQRFGCEPFLSEERYRAEFARGRISTRDLGAVLRIELGDRGAEHVLGTISRHKLWSRVARHGIPHAPPQTLSWLITETSVLRRYRTDLPEEARELALAARGWDPDDRGAERDAVEALWRAALAAVERSSWSPAAPLERPRPRRHCELLLTVCGVDTDDWVHPVLIRFVSAYLDQGIAQWPMRNRHEGMYHCFQDVYAQPLARLCGPWAHTLPGLVRGDRRLNTNSLASLRSSLGALGVPTDEWREYLALTALALRGWAGMTRQIEERPDRVPAHAVPATLADFLAARLLLERAALDYAARTSTSFDGALAGLRSHLYLRLALPPPISKTERAWQIFHVAQLCGVAAPTIDQLPGNEIERLEADLRNFDGIQRRRMLHLAYERHLRHRIYDVLLQQPQHHQSESARVQAIFCIDEREESFRRHLEEADGSIETLGALGFFGVAIYYQGTGDAHPRPLCPVAIRPQHYVAEVADAVSPARARWQRLRRNAAGHLGKALHLGSRTLAPGALLAVIVGPLSAVPLVLRVLFPWLTQRLDRTRLPLERQRRTRLALEREATVPPLGRFTGFTVDEMATIVRAILEDTGIAERLASLIVVVGHGSVSLNNPHESAHDCGACGGGRGGPNARAFAHMANDSRVRAHLALQGLHLRPATWFVGAERNSCDNAVTFFDTDRVPKALQPLLTQTCAAFERAREWEAHERCRRFEIVPGWFPARASLRHVEARAADLAQPRPEYGHATNAFCVIGRRDRTRGLFLDRRGFLASYDPTRDVDGRVLERLLGAVAPVVAGISLEYYFSYVDPTGYGSGTKLPHNVASLLGVMDGAQSDLRTGLPWQMVEIHEPVRLSLVVECPPEWIQRIIRDHDWLHRMVENRWIFVACLDPSTCRLWELGPDGLTPHRPEHPLTVVHGVSADWYRGKRGHLPFARIEQVVE